MSYINVRRVQNTSRNRTGSLKTVDGMCSTDDTLIGSKRVREGIKGQILGSSFIKGTTKTNHRNVGDKRQLI